MEQTKILQIGNKDWNMLYALPKKVTLTHLDALEGLEQEEKYPVYDLVFVERTLTNRECILLPRLTAAYRLFFIEGVRMNTSMKQLSERMMGQVLARIKIQDFLLHETRFYFPKPYGEKFSFKNVGISREFKGEIVWNGNYSVSMEGDFGREFKQILYWRNNIPVFVDQVLDLWLEYEKSGSVEVQLVVYRSPNGSVSGLVNKWICTEEELQNICKLDAGEQDGMIFVTLEARGTGHLNLVALHDRYSRGEHGYFLPGGERYVTSSKEEIFTYFDPGDRRPPINIYFSGYKTQQGFEGYNMMKKMGCPFLLIADPRLEGGDFYIGSPEYEKLMEGVIRRYMDQLKFDASEVTMAGLSMGTTGAMYYGSVIKPHAILLGKPLASMGTIAMNEKWLRPGGFPTSLDVLMKQQKSMDKEARDNLDAKFWDRFDQADWSQTKFIVAYMIEDDYDNQGYQNLIQHLSSGDAQLFGKGLHGRHNDDTFGIVQWFKNQYTDLLRQDFYREVGD